MSNEASADNAASSAAPDKSETTFMQKIRQIMPTFMNKPPRAVVKTPSQKKEELIEELQNQLTFKTVEIATLKTELNRYQAALDLKSAGQANRAHELDCIREDGFPRQRAIGVSAEPETTKTAKDERLKKYSKSARIREILHRAITENELLKNLEDSQTREIVDCMYPVTFASGSLIIQEGEKGSVVYVIEDGVVEVSRDGHSLRQVMYPCVFGELAILYNCLRTATVKAQTSCVLWAIDRHAFQTIMMKMGMLKQERRLKFLQSVPIFESLPPERLAKFVDLLEEVHYEPGEYVIRQGARGDTFYIIANGTVQVTQNETAGEEGSSRSAGVVKEKFVRLMGRGEWFGEKALKNEDVRSANIIAAFPNGVECLVLDREAYGLLTGDNASFERHYPDEDKAVPTNKIREEFKTLNLRDLCVIATLGVGGFGRVELVRIGGDNSRTFALKQLKKYYVVETKQEEHVMNERSILMNANCDFIVKLYRTFKDRKYLYMLLEVCLGGELWTVLRNQIAFSESQTQFYVACVVEGLIYLHKRGIVFRDLKPENLLLDSQGFCKMTDFGFAKNIGFGRKTWTFCGTPEYVAPEIILNKGHDFSADAWSLGILIFELQMGSPPFSSGEPMKTYNIILKGIEAITFPRKISRNAQNLIKKLCRDNPTDRLGYNKGGLSEIKKHVWFEGFDWDGLMNRKISPSFVPRVASAIDMSNFDHYVADSEVPPDDVSGWDKDF